MFAEGPRLVPKPWQEVAEEICCEDRRWARWDARGFSVPFFELDAHADAPVLRIAVDPPSIPAPLHRTLKLGKVELPPGRVSAVQVASGFVVAIDGGGFGGALLAVDLEGRVDEVESSEGIAQVVALTDDLIATVRGGGRASEIVCRQRRDGTWHETFVHLAASSAVIGRDAAGRGIVSVDSSGDIVAIRCSGTIDRVAVMTLGAAFSNVALSGEYKGEKKECLLPAIPTSVRRWTDGRIGVTLRHGLAILTPNPCGGYDEQWFGREDVCDPTTLEPYPYAM